MFVQISPNLPEKFFVRLLPTNFLPQRSWRPFLVRPPKKGFHVFFCKRWSPFLHGISGLVPVFLTNQNFWGCSCTPTSYTTITSDVTNDNRLSWASFHKVWKASPKWRSLEKVIIFHKYMFHNLFIQLFCCSDLSSNISTLHKSVEQKQQPFFQFMWVHIYVHVIDTICSMKHGRRKDFFPGGTTRLFFQIFFQGGWGKSGEFFFPLKTEKTFFAKNFKIQG